MGCDIIVCASRSYGETCEFTQGQMFRLNDGGYREHLGSQLGTRKVLRLHLDSNSCYQSLECKEPVKGSVRDTWGYRNSRYTFK